MQVPDAPSKTLVISYIGMKTQRVAIGTKTLIDVTLEDESTALDDVVVVGYAAVKRRDVVGSVASVNAETLTQMPVNSVTEALSGRMAGVSVTSTEGDPDAEIKIRVRGGGSITQDNSPLYIVDGFPGFGHRLDRRAEGCLLDGHLRSPGCQRRCDRDDEER